MLGPGKVKRFYKQAAARRSEAGGGFQVLLDGRPIKTPRQTPLVLEAAAVAEAIAEEWAAQAEEVVPQSMPLTSMACTALDLVAPRRDQSVAEVADYGAHDLLCYRAERPDSLVERQTAAWQPLLDWAARELDAPLVVTQGVQPVDQPEAALAALTRAVAAHDDLALAALAIAVKAAGSLVIGLALSRGRIDAAAAFQAAELESLYQMELWGEDDEALRRHAALRAELEVAERLFSLQKA